MFKKIYRILTDILGESKQGDYSSDTVQYQFNCPCCADENGGVPDGKYNLEVNLSIGKYNCWKCGDIDGTKGNIRTLIKKYGTRELYNEYKDEIEFLVKSKLYDINLYSGIVKSSEENYLRLPETFTKINLSTLKNNKLLSYLEKRKITQDIIDKFNIGYTTWDEKSYLMRNRLIIPSYDSFGDLNYWTGRDFTDFHKNMKYKNCDCEKKEIIFQESKVNWDSDIILCEGAIDCIYPINAIALLGKQLDTRSYLFKQLYKKANARIIIILDGDTDISETKRMYQKLNFGRLLGKIWYAIPTDYKDIGETYENEGKKGIIKLLRNKRQFKEIDLLLQ